MAIMTLNESGRHTRWRRVFNIAAAVFLTLLIAPWRFSMPKPGLDWSYFAAVAHAWQSGWEWSRDISATFGPLGILYFRPFLEGALLTTALFWIVVALILAINFLDLIKQAPLSWAFVLILGFALPFTYHRVEPVFFIMPLLAAIGNFRVPRPVAIWKVVLLAAVAGPAALIKLSFGILSLAIFVLLDTDRVFRKSFPLLTPVFLVTAFAGYLYAGQDPRHFFDFFLESLGHVSGYSESMQYWGSYFELGFFLLASAVVGFLFWRFELRVDPPPRAALRSALYGACLGVFLFMIFKAGFVRHDVHTITSWDALSAAVAAYTASVWHRVNARKAFACAIGVMLFACGYSIRIQADYGGLDFWNKVATGPVQQLASAALFVVNTDTWLKSQQLLRDAALAAIRKGTPLAPLDGPVDAIPPIQSPLLAHGLDYRPRPVLQEHQAYSDQLIAANLQFLRSDRAPKYVIFGTGSIDGRYPSLADGPMWPDLFRLYEPVRREGRNLLLQRRAVPLKDILSTPLKAVGRFGQGIALPVSGPVFVKIHVRQTLLGRLAQLLFKPGQLRLTVKLADNTARQYLLIPGIVRRGFVLSPLIDNNMALGALSTGRPDLYPDLKVVAFRIDPDRLAKLSYDPAFELEVQPIRIDELRTGSSHSEFQALLRAESKKRQRSNH